MNNILIFAGSGTGKTKAVNDYKNVVDIDTIDYMFSYNKKLYGELNTEELKNLINGWLTNPANYQKKSIKFKRISGGIRLMLAISKALKNNTVLVPLIPDTYKSMRSAFKKARKIFVFPEKDNFEEYAERYRQRGNNENFINVRKEEFYEMHDLLEADQNIEKIFIPKGKYLSDILQSLGAQKKDK